MATKTGDSTFNPSVFGNYYVKVTNSVFTALTLQSDTVNFVPLPLAWLTFSAMNNEVSFVLFWRTSLELNAASFVVQHSRDRDSFIDVGKVGG